MRTPDDGAHAAAPAKPAASLCKVTIQGAYVRELPSTSGRILDNVGQGVELVSLDAIGWVPLIHLGRIVWLPPDAGRRIGSMVQLDTPVFLLDAPAPAHGAVAHKGLPGERYQMADIGRWRPILHKGKVCWISRQFTTVI